MKAMIDRDTKVTFVKKELSGMALGAGGTSPGKEGERIERKLTGYRMERIESGI